MTSSVPTQATLTQKPCSRCGAEKDIGHFAHSRGKGGRHSYCRQCLRIYQAMRRERPEVKAKEAEYLSRPDVQERRRVQSAARDEYRAAYFLAYRTSYRGKLVTARGRAKSKLRVEADPAKRAKLERFLVAVQVDLDRITERELPKEPPKAEVPRAEYGSKVRYKGVYPTREGTFTGRVSVGTDRSVHAGTHATAEQARDAVNRLAKTLLGVENYSTEGGRKAKRQTVEDRPQPRRSA